MTLWRPARISHRTSSRSGQECRNSLVSTWIGSMGRSTRSFFGAVVEPCDFSALLGAKKPSRREKGTVPGQKRNRMRLEHRESSTGDELQTTLRCSAAYGGSAPASY